MPDDDIIIVHGDLGPGASIKGTVNADHIAGRDIVISGEPSATREQFAALLKELQELIAQAKAAGEIEEVAAERAISELREAADAVTREEKPPKPFLLRKLEAVSELLHSAAEALASGGRIAKIIIKAIPFASLLLRLAEHLF